MSEELTTPDQGQVVETQAWYENPDYGFKPEDIGYIQNKKWDNPAKAVTSYRELEKYNGVPAEQILKLPKDTNDAEGWSKVFNRLGRPETADGYGEFKAPEGVNAAIDEGRLKWANDIMHKAGLTKNQRDAIMSETMKFESKHFEEYSKSLAAQQEGELQELRKEWGKNYAEREELGRRAVRTFLPGEEGARLDMMNKIEGAIGTAAMLKLFANIGDQLNEDKAFTGEGSRSYGYTREQALADRQQLMSELSSPANRERLMAYNTGKGPDYDNMIKYNKVIAGT